MPVPSDEPRKLRVAVIMGGPSAEHDVSIASGLQVLAALDRTRYEPVPVHLSRQGQWLIGVAPEAPSLAARADGGAPAAQFGTTGNASRAELTPAAEPSRAGVEALRGNAAVDVVFLALHGAVGEDGTIQGLLTLAGLPFTGSGILASALAMDKVKAKELYAANGIPVARGCTVTRRDLARGSGERAALLDAVVADVGLPCVVKPVCSGSSVATHLVMGRDDLLPALEDALRADRRALVEERLVGTEVTCAVLGGGPLEPAQALPVTEIVPRDSPFFDFKAKYTKGACDDITPARLAPDLTARVQALAVRAHEALGCEGMSRTDFIVRDGVPVALETNTIPGMTSVSLLPQAAAAAGISFPRLIDRLIDSALLRAEG